MNGLIEVPVTTMPLLRTPIHMSYLMYLGERSPALAHRYLAVALRLCRWMGVAPSLLLHSHDFVGADDVPAMSFFPGFRLPGEAKLRLVGSVCRPTAARFRRRADGELRRRTDQRSAVSSLDSSTSRGAGTRHDFHGLQRRRHMRNVHADSSRSADAPVESHRAAPDVENRATTGPSCRSWSRRTTRPRSSFANLTRLCDYLDGSRTCTVGR